MIIKKNNVNCQFAAIAQSLSYPAVTPEFHQKPFDFRYPLLLSLSQCHQVLSGLPPLLRVTPLSSRAYSEYDMIATHFIDDWHPTHHSQQ